MCNEQLKTFWRVYIYSEKIEITRGDLRLKVCHILPKQNYFFPAFTDKVIFSRTKCCKFSSKQQFQAIQDKKAPYTLMTLMQADPFWSRCVIYVFQLRCISLYLSVQMHELIFWDALYVNTLVCSSLTHTVHDMRYNGGIHGSLSFFRMI